MSTHRVYGRQYKGVGSNPSKGPDDRDMDKVNATMEVLAKLPMSGEGEIECPLCKGAVSYSRQASGENSRKGAITFKCSTKGCLEMTGH